MQMIRILPHLRTMQKFLCKAHKGIPPRGGKGSLLYNHMPGIVYVGTDRQGPEGRID